MVHFPRRSPVEMQLYSSSDDFTQHMFVVEKKQQQQQQQKKTPYIINVNQPYLELRGIFCIDFFDEFKSKIPIHSDYLSEFTQR